MQSTINFGYLIFLSVVAALGGFCSDMIRQLYPEQSLRLLSFFNWIALQQGWYVGMCVGRFYRRCPFCRYPE